jgi:predicted NBD/HSP70 family sugar kinase
MKILVVDVGGSKIKVAATGRDGPVKFRSGKRLTASGMVSKLMQLTKGWRYDVVSFGYPGRVGRKGPVEEPGNLGKGWLDFDYEAAFGCPVKIINDAVMQALGSYEGDRMLFLGLGTGIGSALIVDTAVVPLELGSLPFRRKKLVNYLSRAGFAELGPRAWQRAVAEAVAVLKPAFAADYVVLGGGNAEKVKPVPEGARLGSNDNAIRGGFRLWETDVAWLEHVSPPHVYKLLF